MSYPSNHHSILGALLETYPGEKVAAEIGVQFGRTSAYLLARFPNLRLYMVDPWLAELARGTRRSQADIDSQMAHAMRLTNFAKTRRMILPMTSELAMRCVPDGVLNLVFIDGSHQYSNVKKDVEGWWPKIKPGGLLTGHDYWSRKNDAGVWGVRRAVDEFSQSNSLKLEHQDTVWIIKKVLENL